jgi:hypothetical protein
MTCVLPYIAPLPPVTFQDGIPTMSQHALDLVSALTTKMLTMEQTPYRIYHTLHGGVYTRTVTLPPGLWTGALVKRPTTLTIIGEALVYVGNKDPLNVSGVVVIPASAGRKQAFVAKTEITIIMTAACEAKTVAEAEAFLCGETHLLPSLDGAIIEQTGE